MATKVLLIEDDEGIRTTIGLFFQVVLPEVRFLASHLGEAGVALALDETPDIILLDLGLPDINGFEVIRRIRRRLSTPIIVLTARREEGTRERCLELGADHFLPKPFHHRDMVACVNQVLTRPRTGHRVEA